MSHTSINKINYLFSKLRGAFGGQLNKKKFQLCFTCLEEIIFLLETGIQCPVFIHLLVRYILGIWNRTKYMMSRRYFLIRPHLEVYHSWFTTMSCNTDSTPRKSVLGTKRTSQLEGFILSMEKNCLYVYMNNMNTHYWLASGRTILLTWCLTIVSNIWSIAAKRFGCLIMVRKYRTLFAFSVICRHWNWCWLLKFIVKQDETIYFPYKIMGQIMGRCETIAVLLQYPTYMSSIGLSILWSRGWGMLAFFEYLVVKGTLGNKF